VRQVFHDSSFGSATISSSHSDVRQVIARNGAIEAARAFSFQHVWLKCCMEMGIGNKNHISS